MKKWDKPTVNSTDTVYVPSNIHDYLPNWDCLPEKYTKNWHRNKAAAIISTWFYEGLDQSQLTPKQGIDSDTALLHISVCLRSFEPAHEHKIAGCAFLLDQWFEIS